jgi:hypothetical protein
MSDAKRGLAVLREILADDKGISDVDVDVLWKQVAALRDACRAGEQPSQETLALANIETIRSLYRAAALMDQAGRQHLARNTRSCAECLAEVLEMDIGTGAKDAHPNSEIWLG